MINSALTEEIRAFIRSELAAQGYRPARRYTRQPSPLHPHGEGVRAYLASLPVDGRAYSVAELVVGYGASGHELGTAPLLTPGGMGRLASRMVDLMGRRHTDHGSEYWRLAPGQLGGGGG